MIAVSLCKEINEEKNKSKFGNNEFIELDYFIIGTKKLIELDCLVIAPSLKIDRVTSFRDSWGKQRPN